MNDLCFVPLGMLVVLTVVTLLGHGIWLLAAALLRALGAAASHAPAETDQAVECPRCGRFFGLGQRRCAACGLNRDAPLAMELADLHAAARQLERFRRSDSLEKGLLEQFFGAVNARERLLLGEPAAEKPSAKPVAALPVYHAVPVLAQVRAPDEQEVLDVVPVRPEALRLAATESTPFASLRPLTFPARQENIPAQPVPDRPAEAARQAPPADSSRQVPPADPPRPRRALAEVLAAFMEEKNILWGELIGGLLIVGCSIALVISLWKTLEENPYFPFLVLSGITATLLGAGLYTLHHWKLESTSRGLLVIGTLLVPLDFLVMAGLLQDSTQLRLPDLGVPAGCLVVFALLLYRAGRVLVPERAWLLPVAVLGSAASQLPMAWFQERGEPLAGWGLLLGALPVLFQGLTVAQAARKLTGNLAAPAPRPPESPTADTAFAVTNLLGFLGMATFAAAAALGFLVYWSGDLVVALQRLAIMIALTGIAPLACGLWLHRALSGAAELATARALGTAVALSGMALLLAALALAWPAPLPLLAICALNTVVFTAVALRGGLPGAHAAALPCLALGYLIAVHLGLGHLHGAESSSGQLLPLLLSTQSGTALAGLVVLLASLAEATARAGRRSESAWYASGSGAVAFVSLALVTVQQPAAPAQALMISGLYGIGTLLLNVRYRKPALSYLGIGLLVGATLWGACWAWPDNVAAWAALVAGTALFMTLAGRFGFHRAAGFQQPAVESAEGTDFLAGPLGHAAEWTALLAFGMAAGSGIVGNVAGQWLFIHVMTATLLSVTALCRAWERRSVHLTWTGALLIFASLLLLFGWIAPERSLTRTLLLALLGQATLVSLAVALSGLLRSRAGELTGGATPESHDALSSSPLPSLMQGQVAAVLTGPLQQTALVATAVAVPLLLLPERGQMVAFAGYMIWLAVLWLTVALRERRPLVFAAFQTALAIAVGYAVTAWLEGQAWVSADYPAALAAPRSLQAYGIGLAGLALGWIGLRIGLKLVAVVRGLLEPGWPAVDRVVLAGLVVGQLCLALRGIAPGVYAELAPAGRAAGLLSASMSTAFGPGAWALLAILAGTLLLACWDHFSGALTAGWIALAVTVPVLIAGRFESQHAVASALRWGLAFTFLACAVPVWLRRIGANLADKLYMRVDPLAQLAKTARVLLVLGCLVPVLWLAGNVVFLGLTGQRPAGPAPDSFFHGIGGVAAWVIPLAVVSLTLVGNALRERSAGYAFSAGQLLSCSLMGGYALHVVLDGQVLDGVQLVRVLQLGTLGAALWASAWLATRRWLIAWQEDAASPAKHMYMSAQIGLAVLGNSVLLAAALIGLTGSFEPIPRHLTAAFYPGALRGVTEVGSLLGWLALLATAAAAAYRQAMKGTRFHAAAHRKIDCGLVLALGGIGLVAIAFLAVSMARWTAPSWGYRFLMSGAALYALAWALAVAARPLSARQAENEPAAFPALDSSGDRAVSWIGAASLWVAAAGLLAVALGIKAAIWHHDQLWAACAVALASMAGAVVAVARRRDGWAFTAGLGIDLAATLVVWHYNAGASFDTWWFYLVQGISSAGGAGALLWLTARKRFYGSLELRLSASYLLAVQILLALLGNVLLLGLAGVYLFAMPGWAPPNLVPLGEAGGWLAFLLPAAAGLWYAARSAVPRQFAIVGGCGLLLGILAACTASAWDNTGTWLAYHTLTVCWATLGLGTLGLGLVALILSRVAREFPEAAGSEHATHSPLSRWIPEIRRWVELIGVLVVVLALRGINDPQLPYWSVGAMLAVSLMTAGLALWSGKQRHVYQFGVLIDLAGLLVWYAGGTHTLAGFVSVNALCLAVASAFWTALELGLRIENWLPELRGRGLPFRHLSAILALTALGTLAAAGVAADVTETGLEMAQAVTWVAWFATAGAVLLLLWDPGARLASAGLYALGLTAIGLAFNALHLTPERYGWTMALVLGAYVGLTSWLAWAGPRLTQLWQRLRLPDGVGTAAPVWLAQAQLAVSAVVLALSLWIALTFATLGQRLAGPIAALALLPAGVLLADRFHGLRAAVFRNATLVLAPVLLAELGWAMLGADVPLLWLHRSILLMTGLGLSAVIYAVGLGKLPEIWGVAARRIGPVLMLLAAALLLGVLVGEASAYQPEPRRAPMEPWAVVVVALGLVGLIVTGIRYALDPEHDPLALPERGRTMYVYAGEVLLVLLGVHLRLTVPILFRGLLAPYYALIVMGIAFLGVGLSELFKRRGLRVLAEPLERTGLFLPILPLIAFWLRTPDMQMVAHQQAPGFDQVLTALQKQSTRYDQFAWLWFGAAALYGLVAMTRQSFRFALIAALTANFGLWAFFYHRGWTLVGSPQLWLIPLALILLVAEHLNRERLAAHQAAALRYLALGMIYLSSTADMFLTGLSTSLWPALVLMGLAVAGMLIGMLVQVRAYLYLGAAFLFLTVFSMIWNAAVDQQRVWVWWASGIVLGTLILVVFAIFEKRRNDVLQVVEKLKTWN